MPAPALLPEKYYLENFEYLLAFVETRAGFTLPPGVQQFLQTFRAASEPARCLYVRMANRKPSFFLPAQWHYPEIGDLPGALAELAAAGLAQPAHQFLPGLARQSGWDAHKFALLDSLAKAELTAAAGLFLPGLKAKTLPKPALVLQLAQPSLWAEPDVAEAWAQLPAIAQRVQQGGLPQAEFLRFLFFGDLYTESMSLFAVRDLGHLQFETYDEAQFRPRFASLAEAETEFAAAVAYREFKLFRDGGVPPPDVWAWFEHRAQTGLPLTDKNCARLGEWLERQQAWPQALAAYQRTARPPARERQVRLLHKMGRTAEALALAQTIQASPQSADEAFFAQDFLAKLQSGKRTRSTTDFLKKADTLTLAAEHRAYVEGGVVAHWQAAGWQAAHTENWVWDALFALLLWEALFDEQAGGIHHPLQRGPSDLHTPEFYAQRQAKIEGLLAALPHAAAALARAQAVYDQKAGTANPLMGWGPGLWPLVQAYLTRLPWPAVRAVLGQMAQNPKENTRGFPDLFVWNEADYFFAEVKSPNDHLAAQQLFWLQFFAQVGIQARVIRVEFAPEG